MRPAIPRKPTRQFAAGCGIVCRLVSMESHLNADLPGAAAPRRSRVRRGAAATAERTPPQHTIERACFIEGARAHNLKSIRCRIPFGKITVITGVSGSGKSSLAFDTLYAEGQRRFVDCLSTYARQFLPRLDRPDADFIGDLEPPIALRQNVAFKNARSTVGSLTGLSDLLSLVYAHAGTSGCPACGNETREWDLERLIDELLTLSPSERWVLTTGVPASEVAGLVEEGRNRLYIDGSIVEQLSAPATARRRSSAKPPLRAAKSSTRRTTQPIALASRRDLVIDRFTGDSLVRSRAADAIETAWRLGRGEARVYKLGETSPVLWLTRGRHCPTCGTRSPVLERAHFSPESPLGACPTCQGFGRTIILDREKVIPDPTKSVRDGAIHPFTMKTGARAARALERRAKDIGFPLDQPFRDLSLEEQEWVFTGDRHFRGVQGLFDRLERKRYRAYVRIFLARFRGYVTCADCNGTRRRAEALAVRVGDHSIDACERLPIGSLRSLFTALELPAVIEAKVAPVLREVRDRLRFLDEIGLDYLQLARTARTLSGGELQRLRLADALGGALSGTLYVLDEPTTGLHAADTARMIQALGALTRRGNTVVVVEHDPALVAIADHLIVLGPSGGEAGGEVLHNGPPQDFETRNPGFFRAGVNSQKRATEGTVRETATRELRFEGIRQHNLDIPKLTIPLDRLVVVSGVSGSGKSTLVDDVLYRNYLRHAGRAVEDVGTVDRCLGFEQLSDVVLLSQDPPGRSSRSNVITYVGLLSSVRARLAGTPSARKARLKPGAFSFNVKGGRCEICEGLGQVTVEMHFLADLQVQCEACRGRRFQEKVLAVTWKGRNILQLMDLTVREALDFLADLPDAVRRLDPLVQVGLDYLRLGQSTATLSGGEAQRLRIASFLAEGRVARDAKLFLLDEPTNGLHARDIDRLLAALRALIQEGHGVLAIEHQLDFIRAADWVIDLGPGGGEHGGRLLYAGRVSGLVRCEDSSTARALGTHM